MPTVQLNRKDAENGNLPNVCICCGEPATRLESRWFSWNSDNAVFPADVAATLSAAENFTTVKIALPVCISHEEPFIWQATHMGWGCVAFFAVTVFGLCVIYQIEPTYLDNYRLHYLILAAVGGIGWFLWLFRVRGRALRPRSLSEKQFTQIASCCRSWTADGVS